MKPRIVAIWGHMMYGFDLKSGQLSSDWPATGLDIGLPNPAQGGKIGGGVQANAPPMSWAGMQQTNFSPETLRALQAELLTLVGPDAPHRDDLVNSPTAL